MKAVKDSLLNLIVELQTLESLFSFCLAGGTNLALQYNHRISDDIDLFSNQTIGVSGMENLATVLKKKFGSRLKFCEILNQESGNQFCFIRALIESKGQAIKLECIQNVFLKFETINVDGIKAVSVRDIGMLKLKSAASRKANKDIYDLDIITEGIKLKELINLLREREIECNRADRKCLFDLDETQSPVDNLALLLEFDKINYTDLPRRPSHSTDRIKLLPHSINWLTVKTRWRRKVKELMKENGQPFPGIQPVN